MKFNTLDITSNNLLKNAAYSEKYKEERLEWKTSLNDAVTNIAKITTDSISDNYRLREIKYQQTELGQKERKYTLLDKNDTLLFEWICYDSECDFLTLIEHQNGKEYFIFRQELYGYTVLDIETKQTFQYFPQCVQEGYEDFIWTRVHYNRINNLLAVEGCFWACPWSFMIIDFSNPMQQSSFEIDIFEFLPIDSYTYGVVEFKGSEKENFIFQFQNKVNKTKEIISFNPRDYIRMLI